MKMMAIIYHFDFGHFRSSADDVSADFESILILMRLDPMDL